MAIRQDLVNQFPKVSSEILAGHAKSYTLDKADISLQELRETAQYLEQQNADYHFTVHDAGENLTFIIAKLAK